MIRFLECVLLFSWAAGTSFGANWYVDNTASGANNGTSWTDAWENPTNVVWASVNPGDTVFVSGGTTSQTYTDSLSIGKDGTPGNYITVKIGQDAGHNGVAIFEGCRIGSANSYPQWQAIDGGRFPSFVDPTNHDQVIHGPTAITNNIGFWIRNIVSTNGDQDLEDTSPALWYFSSPSNLKFSWIEVSGMTNSSGAYGDSYKSGWVCYGNCGDAVVTNVTFEYVFLQHNSGGLFLWSSQPCPFDSIVWKFGWINLNTEDNFQASHGWTIRDSVIGPVDGRSFHTDIFQMTGDNIKIYNNDIRESQNSILRLQTLSALRYNFWFFNNLVTEKQGRAPGGGTGVEPFCMVHFDCSPGHERALVIYSNIVFANNLFYNSVTNTQVGPCYNSAMYWSRSQCVTNATITNCLYENNIVFDKEKGVTFPMVTNINSDGYLPFSTNSFVLNYNIIAATNTTLTTPTHVAYLDQNGTLGPYQFLNRTNPPMFVDKANDNFELSPLDTNALNNGVDLSAYFNFDSLNRSRGVGGAWDIGPLEYQGGSSTNGSGGSPPSLARVQFKKGPHPSTSVMFDSPNTAGNTIIVSVVSDNSTSPSSITDTAGNRYSPIDAAYISGSTILVVYAAFGIAACTGNVVTANGSLTSPGLTAVEYSGVTSVNTSGHASAHSPYNALSVTLNTSATTMFFAAWGDEQENGLSSTTLSPGSIAGSQIDFDNGRFGGILSAGNYEWLNSASGFAAGNYTVTANTSGANCAWVVVALQGNGSTNGSGSTSGNSPTNSLLVWLKFDDDFSDSKLDDSSGNGNHAYRFGRIGSMYPTNFPSRILSSGIPGRTNLSGSDYCGRFDWYNTGYGLYGREGDYAGITNVASLTNLATATVMCWARYYAPHSGLDYSSDANETLISTGTSAGQVGAWGLGRLNNNIWLNNTRFYVTTNGNSDVSLSEFPENGYDGDSYHWTHYAVTWNNGVAVGYTNGVPVFTNDISMFVTRLRIGQNNNNPTPWIGIGCDTHAGTPPLNDESPQTEYPNNGWLNGVMDEVRIYNTVLSAADIRAIVGGGTGLPARPAPPTGLSGHAP
jgi:hypothetical protein